MTEERQEVAGPGRVQGKVIEARDGAIDFSRYSSEQLDELRYVLNSSAFPLNYANLLAEIERRAVQPAKTEPPPPEADPASLPATIPVRFTLHDGLRGWLQAKARNLSVYGEGFIEIRPQEIVLGGWQRTWLGVAQPTQVFVAFQAIVDVIQGDGGNSEPRRDGEWVRFRYETSVGRYQFVELQTGSIQQAAAVIDALPKARSEGYERWIAVREFDARAREAGADPWITTVLVIANLAVFAVTALIGKSVDPANDTQMVAWGLNFAPLTLDGQWWRLLSALFVHGNLPHVLFNMWALWNIGRLTERLYGNWAFAFLYFAGGVLAGLASIAWDPSRASLGASGAIFGICAAFIVFALHSRRQIAVKVPTALWVSTLIFALYNLVAGFFTVGIDNAAHVGGMISGLALGTCLARPMTAEARRLFPVARAAGAAALTVLGMIAALWQATGFSGQLSFPERYSRAHQWYWSGETRMLREWQRTAAAVSSGQLSNDSAAQRFERDILPFWQGASTRLKKEADSLPPDERRYAGLVAEGARLQFELARASLDVFRGDQSRAADMERYSTDTSRIAGQVQRLDLLAALARPSRALSGRSWVVAIRKQLTGQRWKCIEPPSSIRKPPAAGESTSDGPAARRTAGCRAQELFLAGDYLVLDRWLQRSAARIQDLPDGSSTLEGIVRGLEDLFEYTTLDVVETLRRTAQWQRVAPSSLYPRLVQSLVFESWAWQARGTGAASSISPATWAVFLQRAEMASVELRELGQTGGRASNNPLWYQLSLDVGLDQANPVGELRSIFDRGTAELPGYWPLYSRMLRILMPRWFGSADAVHTFILDVSVTPDGQRDFEKYARLYLIYSSLEYDELDLFGGSLATWSVVSEGFVELLQRYPKSDFIRNSYAKLACMADDADTYNEVRPQLVAHISSEAWSGTVSLKHCDGKFPNALVKGAAQSLR